MIKINGKEFNNLNGTNLRQYLKNNGYTLTFIAVEINGSIIPKSIYQNTFLQNGDNVEIVNFVGGG